jgi:hypothetical protein
VPKQWFVLVTCRDEKEQAALLEGLNAGGRSAGPSCRVLGGSRPATLPAVSGGAYSPGADLRTPQPFGIMPDVEGQAMPLHGWTDERGWDSVHPIWLTYSIGWIQPCLTEGYQAFVSNVPALTLAAGNGKPDGSVRRWEPGPPSEQATGDAGVLEPDLETSVAIRLDPQPAVHVDLHGRLMAGLPLLSANPRKL